MEYCFAIDLIWACNQFGLKSHAQLHLQLGLCDTLFSHKMPLIGHLAENEGFGHLERVPSKTDSVHADVFFRLSFVIRPCCFYLVKRTYRIHHLTDLLSICNIFYRRTQNSVLQTILFSFCFIY